MTDAAFIREHCAIGTAPLVPEIRLHLAGALTPLWEATEAFLQRNGVAPPFWAFAWPGAQALARWVLDDGAPVRGRRVLDWGAGGGLAAIAAARAGAASVDAAEVDPMAAVAIGLNAALNGVAGRVRATLADLLGTGGGWDVVLAGDVFYERAMAERLLPWLRALAADGATVIVADPGRDYLPRNALCPLDVAFDVPVTRDLEDRDTRRTVLYRLK